MLTLPIWLAQNIGRQVISFLQENACKCISQDILASLRTTRIRIGHNFEQLVFFAAKSEMMGMTTVFNASGVDKEDFVKYTEANPATYRVGIPQLKPPIFVSDTNLKKNRTGHELGIRRQLGRKTT